MKDDRFRFRAWNKETKTMHYKAEQTYDCLDGIPLINKSSFGDVLDDENYIVEQCTGLKDKNGKLIYEGDILSCMVNCPRKGVVEFYRNAFCLNENGSYSEDIVFSDKCCEVIGNIHENPEQKQ